MADEVDVPYATPTGQAEAAAPPKKRRTGRHAARGLDGLFDVAGAELVARAIAGEIGVAAARRPSWIAKHIGLRRAKTVSLWRRKKSRPELVQAIALQALFPWIPLSAWLTAEERKLVQAAYDVGQRIAAEPPPNPKTASRKKEKADPRQVTLEEMIVMKTPPAKPKEPAPAPPKPEVALDEPDLGDWDPDDIELAEATRSAP